MASPYEKTFSFTGTFLFYTSLHRSIPKALSVLVPAAFRPMLAEKNWKIKASASKKWHRRTSQFQCVIITQELSLSVPLKVKASQLTQPLLHCTQINYSAPLLKYCWTPPSWSAPSLQRNNCVFMQIWNFNLFCGFGKLLLRERLKLLRHQVQLFPETDEWMHCLRRKCLLKAFGQILNSQVQA